MVNMEGIDCDGCMDESPRSGDRSLRVIKVDRCLSRVIIYTHSPGIIINSYSFYSQKVLHWTISNMTTICVNKHTYKNKISLWIYFFKGMYGRHRAVLLRFP